MASFDTCSRCGSPINTPECVFCTDHPPLFPPVFVPHIYLNHCWKCGSTINSRTCRRSQTPGMGYHCSVCGKDLTEWKQKYYGRKS